MSIPFTANVPVLTSANVIPSPSPAKLHHLHALLIKTGTPLPPLPLRRRRRRFFSDNDERHRDTIISLNSCLSSLSSSGSSTTALILFVLLRASDVLPDTFSCSFAIKAYSQTLSPLRFGESLHALVEKLGYRSDCFLLNTLLHMYASSGAFSDAMKLFDSMPERDVVSWNIMITQSSKMAGMGIARELFDRMPDKSVRSWTALIAGYVQCGDPKEALRVYEEMKSSGFLPNEVTVVAALAACADLGTLDLGRTIHRYASSSGYTTNVRLCNTLIDMYIKCGCIEIARAVFDEMPVRTVVSWSAMIVGHAMHGQASEALKLFTEMEESGVKPNGVTFVGILHACSHMGLVDDGRRHFAAMTEDFAIVPEIEHYGCVVDLLSRAGRLEEAVEFIRKMPMEPNSVVWGALLGGARKYKKVEMAEEAMRHLSRLDPHNDGYYVVLSNIYADDGRFADAARVRRLMRDHGVRKTPGRSTIVLNGDVHEFVAGENDHPRMKEIHATWQEAEKELRLCGYVPDTSSVVVDVEEEAEKERVVRQHSEKLAVALGLLTTEPGSTIRIIKNLRVCNDCHVALKLISAVRRRRIVVRDRNRFHCFSEGSCSCGDYW